MTSTTLDPTIQPTASDRSDTNPRTAAIIAGIGYVLLLGSDEEPCRILNARRDLGGDQRWG